MSNDFHRVPKRLRQKQIKVPEAALSYADRITAELVSVQPMDAKMAEAIGFLMTHDVHIHGSEHCCDHK